MKKSLVCLVALTILATTALGFAAEKPAAPAAPAAAAPAPPPPAPKAVTAGDNVPAWTALSADGGKTVTSASLSGKNYALVFVNASCSACRGELTELSQREFGTDLTVLIASVDIKPDRVASVYKDSYKLPYDILDDSKMELSAKFDFAFTPATVIVGKDGKLVARFLGFSPALRAKLFEAFDNYAKK